MKRAVGEEHVELSGARIELQSPSSFVGTVMVVRAQRQQVVEISGAVVFVPLEQMVDLAPIESSVAVANRTGAIHRAKCSPLGRRGVAGAASDVEWHAV